ncbi:MAG: hypothetical protein ABJO02_06400 [Reichenbachiella sp.]|uniref:hypothetical protein n=1 Tax=Reichenbachiella sp. TaxID=2184521 RepID=UPI00329A0F3F
MKSTLFLLFVALSFRISYCQEGVFYTLNDSIETKIQATTSKYFLTPKGNLEYSKIKHIKFYQNPADNISKKLSALGIDYIVEHRNVKQEITGGDFGFHFEEDQLFYERIFYNDYSLPTNLSGLITKLKALPGFNHELLGSQVIIGSFTDLSIPSAVSNMSTPYLISQGKHKGSFKIQIKDKKYKLEVFNVETWMNIGIDVGMLQDNGRAYIWNSEFINKKGQIKSNSRVVLQSADQYFHNLFSSIEDYQLDDF